MFTLPLRTAPAVTLRPHGAGAPGAAFVVAAPDGTPLLDGRCRRAISPRRAAGCGGASPALALRDPRRHAGAAGRAAARSPRQGARGARRMAVDAGDHGGHPRGRRPAWLALHRRRARPPYRTAFALFLLGGGTGAAVAAAFTPAIVRLRLAWRRRRRSPDSTVPGVCRDPARLRRAARGAVRRSSSGCSAAASIAAAVDLRHFSLHPWSLPRLATLYGILLVARRASVDRRTRLPGRHSRAGASPGAGRRGMRPRPRSGWRRRVASPALDASGQPSSAIVLGECACAAAALARTGAGLLVPAGHVAARILALFMAFLLPALMVYPSVHFFAERSMRAPIETQYAGGGDEPSADPAGSAARRRWRKSTRPAAAGAGRHGRGDSRRGAAQDTAFRSGARPCLRAPA